MEASATAKASVDPRVLITAYNLALNELSKLCTCSIYACTSIPIKILRLCWKTQVFILCLPVRCALQILYHLKSAIVRILYRQKRASRKKLLEAFINCDLGEKEKVLKTMKDFRTGSLIAISKMDTLNKELERCRKLVSRWKFEAERQTKQMSTVVSEEKKLIKTIISAMRQLKTLKSSKEIMNMNLKEAVDGIYHLSANLCNKQFCEGCSEGSSGELNSNYNKLYLQTELMRQAIENMRVSMTTEASSQYSEIFSPNNIPYNNNIETDSSNLLNLSVGALDSILGFLNAENLHLRKRLKANTDQLDDVKSASLTLNDKIVKLEKKLDETMNLLRNVESDRDYMRGKLSSLQQMIEEEENFLNIEGGDSENLFHDDMQFHTTFSLPESFRDLDTN